MKNMWFENTQSNRLEIIKPQSISKHNILRYVIIKDSFAIENLIARITKIPADGDQMISFGSEAQVIELKFHCENQIQNIGIYEKKFKTPSTGFNSGKNAVEESLYRDIDALLFPDFNKLMLKVKNLSFTIQRFFCNLYQLNVFR